MMRRLFLIVFLLFFFSACERSVTTVTVHPALGEPVSVSVRVADDDLSRRRGLQHTEPLAPEEGMLFLFSEPELLRFWMKDVSYPIAMLFLDSERRIVYVEDNAIPCEREPCPLYGPAVPAQYVLEVSAHFFQDHTLSLGDLVSW